MSCNSHTQSCREKKKEKIYIKPPLTGITNYSSKIARLFSSVSPSLHFLLCIFRTKKQMTTKLPMRNVDDAVDVDLNSRHVRVGGCLRGRVTDRKLSTDTGKECRLLSLNETSKQELSCKELAAQSRRPAVISWLELQLPSLPRPRPYPLSPIFPTPGDTTKDSTPWGW